MKITWLGHATFKIESEKTIVTDPHAPQFGSLPAGLTADIVTVSHAHHDHNYTAGVGGNPKIIDRSGDYDFGVIKIKGVPTFHDDEGGAKRGENIVFVLEIEGLRICHLGDLGHLLIQEQLNQIDPIDILMIPVGGFYTIDATQAIEIINQVTPKVVLPMHYKSTSSPGNSSIAPVDDFTSKLGWPVEKMAELNVTADSIGQIANHVIIFSL